ncbi:MAG TPA: DUF721 domain-containing protein [bacterium]|nr:DUF721 domain-containing protein [bacterium]
MREKRKAPVSISDVFARTRGTSAIRQRMKGWRLMERWEEIAGQAVATHSRPARWQGKNLVVRVDSAPWMQELSFLKEEMVARIRKEFPASDIGGIKLEQGELPPMHSRSSKPVPAEGRPLVDEEREFIERSVEEIPDSEVREAARRAMSRSFEKTRG